MSLLARAILLRRQLKSNNLKQCNRCSLVYDRSLSQCPHCKGLNERQVEELIEKQKRIQIGSVLHILIVFGVLALFFGILLWIF